MASENQLVDELDREEGEGEGGGGGGGGSEDDLLKKLEEQNRLLERDRKSHTVIMRSGSTPSISDSVDSLRTAIVNDDHVPFEETMSHSTQEWAGPGSGEGVRRGRSESEALVRLRTESELADLTPEVGQTLGEDAKKEDGEDLWNVWSSILKNWEESSRRNQKQIRQLVRQGIPQPLRGMAWQLLSGAPDPELRDRYPSLMSEVSPFEKQIQRDLTRTFPEHAFFKERDGLGQESLLNILKAYSVHDREVGYCQGSPFITGLLLMQKMPEEDAFCVFTKLMFDYKLRDLFKPSMADLGLCFYQLGKLVEELYPSLYMHFQAVEFQTSMYASPWFLTMFASVLSLNVVFRIMDIFLVEGREIIFKVGLALLEHSQSKLLQLDMEDMLKHFQKEMKATHEGDPDSLIEKAMRIKINQRKMKRLERDYQQRREKETMENSELQRLQQANTDLQKTVKSLEKECASLADKLIQGQVSRAQEAEEMFILKKELAKTRRKLRELEERTSRKESMESNESLREESPKIVNGESVEVKGDDGGEDGEEEEGQEKGVSFDCGPELTVLDDEAAQHLQVKSPVHVTREEAQQVLRKLGVRTPTSPRESQDHTPSFPKLHPSSLPESIKEDDMESPSHPEEQRRASHRHSHGGSHEIQNGHNSNSPSRPECAELKTQSSRDSEQLAQELAQAKLECAEAMVEVEQKRMEARQASLRETQAARELSTARSYISVLEKRLSEAQMDKLSCPHCSQKLGQTRNNCSDSSAADTNSSDVLFSHLRAMWNSQAATNGGGSPKRAHQFGAGPSWT